MTPINMHCLQHVPFEGLGCISDWAAQQGISFTTTHLYQQQPLPSLAGFDFLVIMGGPMNVYEEEQYPWLVEEKRLIKEAIAAGKMVLGICLGAQLIVAALGSKVYRNKEKEIGWFPVRLTEAGRQSLLLANAGTPFDAFHWHGDTFDLPPGAVLLAESEACKNQLFVLDDKVLGIQFHLEATPDTLQEMVAHGKQELQQSLYIQEENTIIKNSHTLTRTNEILHRILDAMVLPMQSKKTG